MVLVISTYSLKAAEGPIRLRAPLPGDDVSFVVEGDVDGFAVLHGGSPPDALVVLLQGRHADEAAVLDSASGLRLGETVRARKRRRFSRRAAGGRGLAG